MDVEEDPANLDSIEKALQSLTLNTNESYDASNAIAVLAHASRSSTAIRQRLADPTIIRNLIDTIDCSINDSLETVEVALRCLGNACIDNESAREEVTKHGFFWAKQCLPPILIDDASDKRRQTSSDPLLAMLTAKVLYNICSDYEPAQQKCYDEEIHFSVIQVCSLKEAVGSSESSLFIELLFWLCSHVTPEEVHLPRGILVSLLTLPGLYSDLDAEDSALLYESCLLFMREQDVKRNVVELKLTSKVWNMLKRNEERLEDPEMNLDDKRLLRPLSTGLIWILSDIAAEPTFTQAPFLDVDFIQQDVIPTISIVNEERISPNSLVDAACQILGNCLWSSKGLVDEASVVPLVKPVLAVLRTSQVAELLHSAAGLLNQLSKVSPRIREQIGAADDIQLVAEKLCGHEMPQLRQDGVALLRELGKSSPANRERFADIATRMMNALPLGEIATAEE